MARRRRIDRQLKELRQRKYRLQGQAGRVRFIPDADRDFAQMAKIFANHVAANAQRFNVPDQQIAELTSAVAAFRDALTRTMMSDTSGTKATRIKNDARGKAKQIIRDVAGVVRGVAKSLTSVDRLMLNMSERPKRLKKRTCPDVAPVLRFIGSTNPSGVAGSGKHVLEYRNDFDVVGCPTGRPSGATRLELFVELVPPQFAIEGKVPVHPGQLRGGVAWYLRSFTTRRFEVDPPVMTDGTPMLVVYWARWADARGGTGRFSQPCVARVEGGYAVHALPGAKSSQIRIEQAVHQLEAKIITFASQMLPASPREFEVVPHRRLLDAA